MRADPGAPLTPASGNRNGYVLEITPTRTDHARRFGWNLMLVCGDPEAPETYFAGYPKDRVSPISCPAKSPSTPRAPFAPPLTATRSSPTTGCSASRQ